MVKVKDVMKSYVVTVGPKAALDEVAKIMSANKIGSVVVVDNGKPVGIVTDFDVVSVAAKNKNLASEKVSGVMKRNMTTASPGDDLLKAVRTMVKNGVKRAPVIDDGRLVGILTDKEVLIATPDMIEVLSERLKARAAMLPSRESPTISGKCEDCGGYSDELKHANGRWICEDCRPSEP
ncbi:MAG: CBS domain-containing protein [Candidatus Aenigmarchaeota archaeon]